MRSALVRLDLILIDDDGLLPVSACAAEAMFRVIDGACENAQSRSAPNPSVEFDELTFKTLATAIVERLIHHAHVLITDAAESWRLALGDGCE